MNLLKKSEITQKFERLERFEQLQKEYHTLLEKVEKESEENTEAAIRFLESLKKPSVSQIKYLEKLKSGHKVVNLADWEQISKIDAELSEIEDELSKI